MAAPFVLAGVAGLLFGSFLNVVAHRLPKGMSLVAPRSACPCCATPVRPYDNVPVLSWLVLRGRCRDCAAPISARYPLVEAGTALLWIAVALVHFDDLALMALGLVLVTLLVPIALIDLDHRLIPNKLTGAGVLLALGLGVALDPSGQPERLIAAFAAGGPLILLAFLMPGGMGMGDGKLVFMLGLFLGAHVAVALMVALVVGSVVGGLIIARVGMAAGRKTKLPFGPFLALGGVVGLLAGEPLLELYLGTFG